MALSFTSLIIILIVSVNLMGCLTVYWLRRIWLAMQPPPVIMKSQPPDHDLDFLMPDELKVRARWVP